jgi:uncharacterized protein (DUF885 family)
MNRGISRIGGSVTLALAALYGLLLNPAPARGGDARTESAPASGSASYVPDLPPLLGQPSSELRDVVERFTADRAALLRRYGVEYSPTRREKMREFYTAWQSRLAAIDFGRLSQDGRIDYLLLKNRLGHELDLLTREEKTVAETSALMPFAGTIIELQEARRRMETINPAAAAGVLAQLSDAIEKTRTAVEAGTKADAGTGAIKPTKIIAYRAAEMLGGLQQVLEQWFKFYDDYDPLFTWWASAPYKKADESLKAYVKVLREKVIGIKEGEDEPIIGHPIGRDALVADLAYEMIPYTPEELVAIAEREFAWCEAEMRKASRAMGLGDDWKAALERVKSQHVEPGRQPDLIRDLAREAIEFVEKHDLVTVPPLARDIWRMEMLSAERQKESPFFLGGEVIQVSYPTDTMSQEDKLMSMRGNNVHFARATVFHELIPGHHLQGFMTDRYSPHRRAFATPFSVEGWAFHWEMLLWDLNFARSPEDRIGMLFWRMHRAARIIFSLGFHLGTMTPQQCIDFLVDRVGHERANATGEVRRSFIGRYPPLYQVAYMLGALQFRALHRELVDSGRMTHREFHDTILKGGPIPVEMVRALLTKQLLTRDYAPQWRFAGEIPTRH